MIDMSNDEARSIESVLASISARAHRTITLAGLIEQWELLVEQVEAGYGLTGYDYINDLATRDLIEEVLASAAPLLQKRITVGYVDSVDTRFRHATRPVQRPLQLGHPVEPKWWWCRLPNDLSGELARDLLAWD